MSKNHDYRNYSAQAPKSNPTFEVNDVPEVVCQPEINEEKTKIGVVTDCIKLNIRARPSKESEVIAVLDCGTEIMIDDSYPNFYKIITAAGVEGYAMAQYITVKQ